MHFLLIINLISQPMMLIINFVLHLPLILELFPHVCNGTWNYFAIACVQFLFANLVLGVKTSSSLTYYYKGCAHTTLATNRQHHYLRIYYRPWSTTILQRYHNYVHKTCHKTSIMGKSMNMVEELSFAYRHLSQVQPFPNHLLS